MNVWMIGAIGATLGVASLLLAWTQNREGATFVQNLPFNRSASARKVDPASASIFLALLSIAAFAMLALQQGSPTAKPLAVAADSTANNRTENTAEDLSNADAEIARIGAYLESVGRSPAPKPQSTPPPRQSADLPDVDTMIAQLEARLETTPNDVDGWRTLGWSYRNTDRPAKAVVAYERAADLAPERTDIAEALAEARSAVKANDKPAAAQLTK